MKILLADDHRLIRENLGEFLVQLEPDVQVLEAGDFQEAHDLAASDPGIDLAILDLVMPGMNGLEGLAKLRKIIPDVPIVIMSGVASRIQAVQVLDHGAAGFIPKTIGGQAMLSALRLVLSGEKYLPEMVLGVSQEETYEFGAEQSGAKLTKREREVLAHLVEGASNKLIARHLEIREVTVKVHLQSVFRKLGVSNRTQAATAAVQRKLVAMVSGGG